jgi:hypothetical protein
MAWKCNCNDKLVSREFNYCPNCGKKKICFDSVIDRISFYLANVYYYYSNMGDTVTEEEWVRLFHERKNWIALIENKEFRRDFINFILERRNNGFYR